MSARSLLDEHSVAKWAADDYRALLHYYTNALDEPTKKCVIKTIRQTEEATADWFFPHAGLSAGVVACFITLG